MKTTKKCEFCEKEFSPKRNDARFCSPSCRSKHWATKELTPDNETIQSQLRGVISNINTEKEQEISPVKDNRKEVLTNVKQTLMNRLNDWQTTAKRLVDEKKMIETSIQKLKVDEKAILSFLGLGLGAWLGNQKTGKTSGTIIGGGLGFLGANMITQNLKPLNKQEREKQILILERGIQQNKSDLIAANNSIMEINGKITKIDFELIDLEINELPKQENKKILPKRNPNPIESKPDFKKQQMIAKPKENDKIISSMDLSKLKYKALNFTDNWLEFFGYPSVNFHCVVHGLAGEGKSTFCIQFANYLAENFGTVIYISGEEGFSKTLKDKFNNNNAFSENLFVADLRNYQDITKEIKPNIYNFVFIDSLNNMKIGADEMKEIRQRYHQSAVITICQATKDGKMRGSYEVIHDCDIAVKVEKGIAVTEKNRFKEKGAEFEVF